LIDLRNIILATFQIFAFSHRLDAFSHRLDPKRTLGGALLNLV
jgi:hypothetical protein